MLKSEIENTKRVYVSGEVKYGDEWFRVASGGTVIEPGETESLINIDNVDGDGHVNLFVENKYLSK